MGRQWVFCAITRTTNQKIDTMKTNPARQALTNAVNRAIAAGSPVFVEVAPVETPRQTLERIHNEITTSEIFRLDGAKIDLPAKLIELADAITADPDEDGSKWSIGEHTIAPLDELVTGAYWSLVEWHGGQYSDTYAAMCALGRIFSTGCGSGPTEETAEWDAYDAINNHFQHLTVAGL